MGDSYRPNRRSDDDRYCRRDYQDIDDRVDDNNGRRSRRSRSRSPQRLDYGGGDADDEGGSANAYTGPQDVISNPGKYATEPRAPPPPPQAFPPRGYGRTSRDFDRSDMYDRPAERPPNHGERDQADNDDKPLNFVLVLNLKQSVDEERFAKGLEKLYRDFDEVEGGATPKSLKRVMLIRDRRSNYSQGFGFAEYHDVEDAKKALEKSRIKAARDQLTIASMKVKVCFPHMGVFPHDSADAIPEWNPSHKFKMHSGHEHKYHDRRYYASVYDVNVESPHGPLKTAKTTGDASKKSATKKKATETTLDGQSKKRKAPGTAAPAILGNWASKQAELRSEEAAAASRDTDRPPATGVNAILQTTEPTTASTTKTDVQTYAYGDDKTGIICYLCHSQFKQMEGITRHVRESKMHASYLQDEKMIQRAHERMKDKGIDPATTIRLPPPPPHEDQQMIDIEMTGSMYRDRAAERRKEQGETGPPPKVGFSLKNKSKTGAAAASSPTSSDNEVAKTKPNYGKAANMLAKHGWTEGQGLGAGGEGLAAPIEANAYAQGVGLGHEGSKKGDAVEEAEKATKGDGKGYAEAGKERLWDRYSQV